MITFDASHKQILSSLCKRCPDPYFAPSGRPFASIGCCSYSPVFTLFELYKMVTDHNQSFFLEQIYHNADRQLFPYQILIRAQLHPDYKKEVSQNLSQTELADQQIGYKKCQFFKDGLGCSLPPRYKTSVCRSFVCLTVEEHITPDEKRQLSQWHKEILGESTQFCQTYQPIFEERGWNLIHHPLEMMAYFEQLD